MPWNSTIWKPLQRPLSFLANEISYSSQENVFNEGPFREIAIAMNKNLRSLDRTLKFPSKDNNLITDQLVLTEVVSQL